jgi:hypothetical protein
MRSPLLLACVLSCLGCEEKKETPGVATGATTSAPAASLAPPPIAKPPFLSVDEKACHVGGDLVDLTAGDAKARVAAVLATKPKVDGEMLELHAPRDVKFAKMAALIGGVRGSRAKGVVIKTARRDQTIGDLEIQFAHPALAACSAIASIGKDFSINVWPAGGGTAERFSHGMAGPDMTRGVAGAQKQASACDSTVWAVTADDNVQWGLVFDLATMAMGAFDGGKPMRATQIDVIESAVAGRKVP